MKDRKHIDLGKYLAPWSLILLLLGETFLLVACGGAEKEALTKQAAEFQDKAKSLEQKSNERDGQIRKLEEERKDLLGRIPESHVIAPGENHWQIAYDFLTTKKNVPAEDAGNILAETILFDKILVGNKLWNYFVDDTYGTFLTQGEAAVSPGWLQRAERQNQEKEKQKLTEEISNWQKHTVELEKMNAAELEKWKGDLTALQDRIRSLDAELLTEKNQSKNLEVRLNSVYYLAGSKNALKASGKIKGTFLGLCGDRIKNVTFSDFQKSLDLRNSNIIELKAADFGLSRIHDVDLLPGYLEEDKDFRLEIAADGTTASVQIQDREKFQLARVVLVLD